MSTDLPPFISAEAAVKSKRKDYVSLFDPKADVSDLKKCRSDPALMKQAVKKLKQAGFRVTEVTSCTTRIKAPPETFESTFDVNLAYAFETNEIPQEEIPILARSKAAGKSKDDPSPLIRLPASSELGGLVDSVLLDTHTARTSGFREDDAATGGSGISRSTNPSVIYLDEIPGLLEADNPPIPTGRGQEVAVLDDNLYNGHPYFEPFRRANNLAVSPAGKWVPPVPRPSSSSSSSSSSSAPAAAPVNDAHRSHGTQVTANVFAVARDVEVSFYPFGKDRSEQFRAITQPIVNCSWGTFPACPYDDSWPEHIKNKNAEEVLNLQLSYPTRLEDEMKRWQIRCLEKHRQIILWSAGNAGGVPPAQAYLNHLPNVIVVSCALPKREVDDGYLMMSQPVEVKACEHACGGRRYLWKPFSVIDDFRKPKPPAVRPPPQAGQFVATTVAGVLSDGNPNFGGSNGGVRVPCVPTARDAVDVPGKGYWKQSKGTSFAAPQVAGVCAMILEVWEGATPADVKSILTATSTPVEDGKSWEGFQLWDKTRGTQVGLVHIGRAVRLAEFMSQVITSSKFSVLRNAAGSASDGCAADVILRRLRLLSSNPGPDALALRSDAPFDQPLHFVSLKDAYQSFGITSA